MFLQLVFEPPRNGEKSKEMGAKSKVTTHKVQRRERITTVWHRVKKVSSKDNNNAL